MGVPGGGTELVRDVLTALAESLHVTGVALDGPLHVSVGNPTGGAVVPLRFAGRDEGTLRVGSREGQHNLAPADLRLLDAVAPWIAAAARAVLTAEDLRVERGRVIAATQSERSRLRQELHDGLGPSLTGIALGLEAARRSGATEELITRLHEEVAASLEEVRRIIEDLQPSALDGGTLVTALRRRTQQVALATGLDVRLQAPDTVTTLPDGVASAAYRIVDEALTNVVRHAHARHCEVVVTLDGCLHLEVNDDGVGPGRPRDGGIGLGSMRDRAERLGGRFAIQRGTPGTCVQVDLPTGLR